MSAPYDILVFDFDGTLVDTLGDITHHANRVLTNYGHSARPMEAVKESIGWGVHELLKDLAPEFTRDPVKLEQAVDEFKTAYAREPVLQTRPFPGVREVLEGPLLGTRKAIVTNKPHGITLQILDVLGLSGYFEKVIGMHAGFPPKPDPEALNHVIRSFGGSAKKTVYVGDSHVDAQTSLAAGVDFAWVDYGYHAPKDLEPRYHFSSAKDWVCLVS